LPADLRAAAISQIENKTYKTNTIGFGAVQKDIYKQYPR